MDRDGTAPRCQHQSYMTGFSLLGSSCLCQVTPKLTGPQRPKDPQQDIHPLSLGLPSPQSKNQHSCSGLQGLLEQVPCPHVLASHSFSLACYTPAAVNRAAHRTGTSARSESLLPFFLFLPPPHWGAPCPPTNTLGPVSALFKIFFVIKEIHVFLIIFKCMI